MARLESVALPEFELDGIEITLSAWFVQVGDHVVAGDRLLEVTAGPVVIDIPTAVTGILTRQHVEEDQSVRAGTLLASIRPDAKL